MQFGLFAVIFLLGSYYLHITSGLIGYDCSSGDTQITTISLNDIGKCDIPEIASLNSLVYLQLLQLSNLKFVQVSQCKVEILRQVFHCGWNGYLGGIHNGIAEYMLDLNTDECRKLQEAGRLTIGNSVLDGLRRNNTETRSLTLAGSVDSNGYCKGVPYSDHFGHYGEKVIAQATIKVTLQDYMATVNLDDNKIHMREGYSCDFNLGNCNDAEGGFSYWERLPKDSCNFDHYVVLFEGQADKAILTSFPSNSSITETLYTVQTQDTTFTVKQEKIHTKCGYQLVQTEHPKLFILEGSKGSFFTSARMVSPKEMDIFAYVNSKFVYVEKHFRRQMKDLYRDVLLHRCELEQKVLRNSLNIASISPDLFGLDYTHNKKGMIAILGGETIHLIKCLPVIVKVRKTDECYQELPVFRGTESYFLTPRTRILKKVGTQVTCNTILPILYQLDGGTWFKFSPSATETVAPHQLQPNDQATWEYKSIGNLATSGIYSQEELDQLRNEVMFPSDRPALLNILARRMNGLNAHVNNVRLDGLLDMDAIEKLASTTWEKFWNSYTKYGNVSAGILMTLLIYKVTKIFLGTICNMFALHSAYGFSLHLLASCWNGATNLFLHRYHRTQTNNREPEEDARELMPIHSEQPKEPTVEPTGKVTPGATPPVVHQRNQVTSLYPAVAAAPNYTLV